MKIVIALPRYYTAPIGGYHVHYTYANLLQARGHDVTIVFPRYPGGPNNLKAFVKTPIWALATRLRNRPLIPAFPLDPAVRVTFVRNLSASALPNADILIATSWETAEAMADAPPHCGRKAYLVYDYEHLMVANSPIRARILATYRLGFAMVASSTVIRDTIVEAGGTPVAAIPCGLDLDAFGLDVPHQDRHPLSIGFPIRKEKFKGAADAIAASKILADRYGDEVRVSAFGSHKMDLPPWVRWVEFPTQEELRRFYNEQSVFLLPSHFEGWGLPGVEAMACGAAVVVADNGGCRDYAIDRENALVVEPKRPDLLADAVDRLFSDKAFRIRLAEAGRRTVQQFKWTTAVDELERVLLGLCR